MPRNAHRRTPPIRYLQIHWASLAFSMKQPRLKTPSKHRKPGRRAGLTLACCGFTSVFFKFCLPHFCICLPSLPSGDKLTVNGPPSQGYHDYEDGPVLKAERVNGRYFQSFRELGEYLHQCSFQWRRHCFHPKFVSRFASPSLKWVNLKPHLNNMAIFRPHINSIEAPKWILDLTLRSTCTTALPGRPRA